MTERNNLRIRALDDDEIFIITQIEASGAISADALKQRWMATGDGLAHYYNAKALLNPMGVFRYEHPVYWLLKGG